MIDEIDLSKCKPYKDFGKGFYLTPLKSQAEDMALRRVRMSLSGAPCVTPFLFDENILKNSQLRIKVFPNVSVEWAEFILKNRDISRTGFTHDYDIVVGPVADDTVAFQLRRYLLGVISLKDLVKELAFKGLNSQYFFGTDIAISKLELIHE